MFGFTEEQIRRYSRQIILPDVGGKGQKKLLESRVLLIGAGGLGSPAGLYLAAAGVGTLGGGCAEAEVWQAAMRVIKTNSDLSPSRTRGFQEISTAEELDTYVEFLFLCARFHLRRAPGQIHWLSYPKVLPFVNHPFSVYNLIESDCEKEVRQTDRSVLNVP